ncbi:MAG: FliH/SctL family protein [Alphaproteobacteria bacterium]
MATAESTSMAETPSHRKFMFDRSFDGLTAAQRGPAPRAPVTLKPEQVDALKKEAYDAGYIAGQKAAAEQHAQGIQLSLNQLDSKISHLLQNFQDVQKEQDVQMRAAVLAIAKKLLPDLTAKHGLTEIQALLNDAIAEMVHEPRLVVRIHESEFDAVNTKIHEITVQKAYAGKVVVLADAEIAQGDCRVEWADGGIERNVQDSWQTIEQVVAPGNAQDGLTKETNNG